uniref:Tudor domain-containing protein n=1 Tax=Oncorhynchus tshawytscha TaxID=74940 RepID=A0A8C8D2Z8_ONCTS
MAHGCKDVLFARGAAQSDDSDIWDDTALIKAYDKAVASFKTALKGEEDTQSSERDNPGKKRKNNRNNRSRKRSNAPLDKEWRVGDSCCAYWSKDGNLYAATISSIDEQRGTCIVVFTHYGNEEEQNLRDLLIESSEVDEEAPSKVKEAESSTEESDRSSTPHPHSHVPRSKPKFKSPKGPPMSGPGFPGFPPGPPPMPGFRMMIPPPPPMSPNGEDDEALGSMLLAWYMSGYHTGYYLGLKQGRKEAASGRKTRHK